MKKIILFLMFSVSLAAQKIEFVKLNGNIKDKNTRTRSLTFIDNRIDKVIGSIADKKETAEIKFENEDLKNYIEKWFSDDNKKLGTNDIVIMLEELKAYNEQDENKIFLMLRSKSKFQAF
jgi:hypothetical protein